jgi:hypothetical protein
MVDASFDDVAPLAEARFPSSWAPLVRRIVRDHLNLNNAAQISRYPGPVLFYRRVHDEIIAIESVFHIIVAVVNDYFYDRARAICWIMAT